jgi:hypothetical protein
MTEHILGADSELRFEIENKNEKVTIEVSIIIPYSIVKAGFKIPGKISGEKWVC